VGGHAAGIDCHRTGEGAGSLKTEQDHGDGRTLLRFLST